MGGEDIMIKYKYECNVNYFETIDTEDKAYWLGFIYADGCIDNDCKVLIINLNPIDLNHLILFNECIGSNYPITYQDNNRYISLRITRKEFVKHLVNKGCTPRKSLTLKFPTSDQLPLHLVKHFIRGYFDGDGCLHTRLRKCLNKLRPYLECEVNFLGTYDMLYSISQNIPINNIKILQFGNIYKFRISSKKNIILLLDYLYQDSLFYLQRKYDKYITDIKNYKLEPLDIFISQNPVTITG